MSFMTDGTKSVGDWSASDFIFIFILSFLITTIVYYFREESKYAQTYINGLIECFICVINQFHKCLSVRVSNT